MYRLTATLAAVAVLAAPSVASAAPAAHHHAVKAHAAELSPWDIVGLISQVLDQLNQMNMATIRNLN